MTDERFMIGQPIRSLQYMLGELSHEDSRLPFVAPDGVFGEETLEAVMVFQREFCPPVTGRVDLRTWEAITEHYLAMERERAHPTALTAFPPRPFQIAPNDTDDIMPLVHVMFQSLSSMLDEILPDMPNNHHGPRSVRNTQWLQRISGYAETGIIDRFTWNMLARLYSLFLVRRRELLGDFTGKTYF